MNYMYLGSENKGAEQVFLMTRLISQSVRSPSLTRLCVDDTGTIC